ncbi:MAG: peptidase domain-containing ABC transporter [Chitinophagaceae bacterium]|nr:peptidase domain-containing ABC transporter [Chitinophagaceae bacterium]
MKKISCIKQQDATDCGPACLVAVAASYNVRYTIATIRQWAGTDGRGTNMLGMINACRKMGMEAKAVRATSDHLLLIPLPAIAHLQMENGLLHFVVIATVQENRIRIMDPATGLLQWWPLKKFAQRWSGILLLPEAPALEPGAGKTRLGFRRLWYLMEPHRHLLWSSLAGALIYTLLGLSMAIYLQWLLDIVLSGTDTSLLNGMSSLLLFIIWIQVVLGTIRSYMGIQIGQHVDAGLLMGYYRHLMHLPQRFFDSMRIGEIISRVNDAGRIRQFMSETIMQWIVNSCILLSSLLLMFIYQRQLALMLLLLMPVYGIIYWIGNRFNRRWQRVSMEQLASLEAALVDGLQSVTTHKKFGTQQMAVDRVESRALDLIQTMGRTGRGNNTIGYMTEGFTKTITILVLWVGSDMVLRQALTAGTLLSFYAIAEYFTGPVQMLIGASKSIQENAIATDRLLDILDLEEEALYAKQKIVLPDQLCLGPIVFRGVDFQHGPRRVLFEDLNLIIQPARLTGITGESGAGKSTVFAMLLKLYPLAAGQISINNIDIALMDTCYLRQRISTVPQQVHLLPGTLLENICLDQPAEMGYIQELAQRTGLHVVVDQLPDGYDTVLQDRGIQLSGGELQKLALVRALYRKPDILLLDEASASLDRPGEEAVMQTIKWYVAQGKTVVFIAHRMQVLQQCDEVLVLSGGKLVQQGTHAVLMQQAGVYRNLWEAGNGIKY